MKFHNTLGGMCKSFHRYYVGFYPYKHLLAYLNKLLGTQIISNFFNWFYGQI